MQVNTRQLTLLVTDQNEAMEKIRAMYNPVQPDRCHVTLCREDEIEQMAKVIENFKSVDLGRPIKIVFGSVERFADRKGVLIPARPPGNEFHELRRMVLRGLNELPRMRLPHITLLHPRNAVLHRQDF